jgi:cytochrome c-type protein NapC
MSIRRWVQALRTPSARYSLGALIAIGAIIGVVTVPAFLYAVDETSTDAFCLTCHARDIGLEMSGRVHNDNALGVRVSCADCHLPKAFVPKLVAKTTSGVKDIYKTMLGTIDTPAKFEAHRMTMATTTWEKMNANDSRECRYCHDQNKWDISQQSEKARKYHSPALSNEKTCIDCHKGIAHELPQGIEEDQQIDGVDLQRAAGVDSRISPD